MSGYEGKGLLIWQLPADPRQLGVWAKAMGHDYVDIKVHDGASAWGANRHVTRAYVDALRGTGLRVTGWGYVYCDGRVDAGDRGDGVPELEAAAATNAVHTLGLDGYSPDLEIESEGHSEAVGQFFAALDTGWDGVVGGEPKAPIDCPVGVIGWADGHGAYAWDEIAVWLGQRKGVYRPMCYRPGFAVSNPLGPENVPFAPIVSLFGVSRDRLASDLRDARTYGAVGVAAWEATARGEAMEYWATLAGWTAPKADPEQWRGPIFALAGQLYNAGYPEGVEIQNVIRRAKGEVHEDRQSWGK